MTSAEDVARAFVEEHGNGWNAATEGHDRYAVEHIAALILRERKEADARAEVAEAESAERLEVLAKEITALRDEAEKAEAESARLTEALTAMVSAKALQNVRSIVAGWNGEGRPDGPYERRHPANLGAKIETNCGAFYELDEAMQKARAALNP